MWHTGTLMQYKSSTDIQKRHSVSKIIINHGSFHSPTHIKQLRVFLFDTTSLEFFKLCLRTTFGFISSTVEIVHKSNSYIFWWSLFCLNKVEAVAEACYIPKSMDLPPIHVRAFLALVDTFQTFHPFTNIIGTTHSSKDPLASALYSRQHPNFKIAA